VIFASGWGSTASRCNYHGGTKCPVIDTDP
jgi:hypothetical protein